MKLIIEEGRCFPEIARAATDRKCHFRANTWRIRQFNDFHAFRLSPLSCGVLAKTCLPDRRIVIYAMWSKPSLSAFWRNNDRHVEFYLMFRDAREFSMEPNRSAGRFITWQFLRYAIMCGYLAVVAENKLVRGRVYRAPGIRR